MIFQEPAEPAAEFFDRSVWHLTDLYIFSSYFFLNKSLPAIIHNSALFSCQELLNTAILYFANWFGVFDDVSETCNRII
jgi:hypothetical protein